MTPPNTAVSPIHVATLVDGQKINRLLIMIMALGFLAQIGDGYDLAAAAYAAPGIVRALDVTKASFAPVLSASLFGMLFGAPLFGFFGDRFGRRIAIIICSLMLGVFTLATGWTSSLLEMGILRFLTGLALGGLPANTIALMAEEAPQRLRALLITIMFMGITFGGMVPAMVTMIAPHAEWRLFFIVGGVMPLVAAVLNAMFMPESLKFLALRNPSNPNIVRLARLMRPDMAIADNASFGFAHSQGGKFTLGMLFAGRLKWITPLLWLIFSANVMTNYFLNSWMPTLFQAAGLSPSDAAFSTSMYYVGGVIGGLTMSRFIDKSGVGIVAVFMGAAILATSLLGFVDVSAFDLKLAVLAVGLTVLGNQLALNAVMGMAYPTAFRANGTGWCLGIGRIAAIMGPIIGGALIARHLPLQRLFLFPSIPLFVGFIASLLLWRQWEHVRNRGAEETASDHAESAQA